MRDAQPKASISRLRRRTLLLFLAVVAGIICPACDQSAAPDAEDPRGPLREWFYAGGWIQSQAGAPGSESTGLWSPAHDWVVAMNLGDAPAEIEINYYFEDHPPAMRKWRIGQQASSALPLHKQGGWPVDPVRYGVRVRSPEPIVLQSTRGETPADESVTGAMSSFVAYPGPLGRKETRWAYADGLVLASESPLEEREWITILNPNPGVDARVELVFLVDGKRVQEALTVPAERVRTVDLFNLKVFPKNRNSGVIVASSAPIVVEQTRRAYRKGDAVTASMWSCFAHPIGDLGIR